MGMLGLEGSIAGVEVYHVPSTVVTSNEMFADKVGMLRRDIYKSLIRGLMSRIKEQIQV